MVVSTEPTMSANVTGENVGTTDQELNLLDSKWRKGPMPQVSASR